MSVPELRAAQSLLSQLIRATDGVARTLQAGGPEAQSLESELLATVRSDARLDAVHRLEVYANAYFFRILDCLREDFTSLAAGIGEAAFHDLITAYLLAHPSSAFSMRQVGQHLPGFVATAPEVAALRERFPWVGDLAWLEWSLLEAFDAPDAPSAAREDYAAVAPEAFASLCFWLDPSVRRLRVDPRALRVDEAVRAGETIDPGPPGPEEPVLIWRRSEQARLRSLSPEEALALDSVAKGASFGEICVRVAELVGEERAAGLVAGWLAGWLDSRCLARDLDLASGDSGIE